MIKNNKKLISKIITIGVGIVVAVNFLPVTAYAADDSGDVRVMSCTTQSVHARAMQGGKFLQMILTDMIGDLFDFQGGGNDIWSWFPEFYDIFMRNECHALDIFAVLDQRDTQFKQITKNLMSCKIDNMDAAIMNYYKLDAEVYYLRHVIDPKWRNALPTSTINTYYSFKELPNLGETNKSDLYADMRALFVEKKDWFTKESKMNDAEFARLFSELEGKYLERKYDYLLCPSDVWKDLVEKWGELEAFFTGDLGLENELKAIEQASDEVFGKCMEYVTDASGKKVCSRPSLGQQFLKSYSTEFFQQHLAIGMNGIDVPIGKWIDKAIDADKCKAKANSLETEKEREEALEGCKIIEPEDYAEILGELKDIGDAANPWPVINPYWDKIMESHNKRVGAPTERRGVMMAQGADEKQYYINLDEQRTARNTKRLTLEARFESKYMYSDLGLQMFLRELNNLQIQITNTYDVFDAVIHCGKRVTLQD